MTFIPQRLKKNCPESFRFSFVDIIKLLQEEVPRQEKLVYKILNPISNLIHKDLESGLSMMYTVPFMRFMEKWKNCDSDECRSKLLLYDNDSLIVQQYIDRLPLFSTNLNHNYYPLGLRQSLLFRKLERSKDSKSLGFDVKEALKCVMRLSAEDEKINPTVTNKILKLLWLGSDTPYITNFDQVDRCLNESDYISLNDWSDVQEHTKVL